MLLCKEVLLSLIKNLTVSRVCFSRVLKKKILWKAETVARRSSVKKVFLKISQNAQEKTCVGVSFLHSCRTLTYIFLSKKRLRHNCFYVNFAKFLRTCFLQTSRPPDDSFPEWKVRIQRWSFVSEFLLESEFKLGGRSWIRKWKRSFEVVLKASILEMKTHSTEKRMALMGFYIK